ncbi:serine protein kinase RIO [Candidatus Accumulibacter phosphatis]|jgi:RIO kinase 1|uniref:non-specific serine/threonine protein kinase n=1 Tax=Candidatus Accumulibacter phosphatis TaxID=327160 RepID=A0ABX1U2N3_9PROT|nr:MULTISPECIES: PA4780 family RIO1-like protein kinase [Candidatus Accumulibacter]NMQ29103.1 serine protein kinase RIO [Candidatus Accumulibacter phosphatis]
MKTPARLLALVEEGLVDQVLGQLMSGKEATVYVVRCGDDIRCAKVYKEASQRSFRNNASYQEGRKVRNSRQARAMEKGSRFGRKMQEEVWQSAEVDALYRLAAAGVRVPQPHLCYEGVLLMDLIVDADGHPAPRLNDVELSEELALEFHALLIEQVVRMLCAGIIHGDLSEYNILVGEDGPVIIDVPQAIDAAGNSNAAEMFARDVINLRSYFSSFAPSLVGSQFGKEIWAHYESGLLTPELALTGRVVLDERLADVDAVLQQVELAIKEDEIRRMCREDQ